MEEKFKYQMSFKKPNNFKDLTLKANVFSGNYFYIDKMEELCTVNIDSVLVNGT